MWAAEQMMEQEEIPTRRNASLFGQLSTEFKKHTSDLTDLPIDPRTEASEVTVERILTKFMPTGAQVKEVFNTIPQYAFQDIPEQPRLSSPSRFSPPVRAPERSPRGLSPRPPHVTSGPPPLEGVQGVPPRTTLSPPRPARR